MNVTSLKIVAAAIAIASIGALAGYWFAHRGDVSTSASSTDGAGERKVLYWYDPMVPNQHFDKPGKSPFMDMQLVPKYADEEGGASSIRIDPGIAQNLGVRVAPVERSSFAQTVDAAGNIVFNQRLVAIVQSKTNGFVARVYARAPGDVIARGAPLVDLLAPEWAGAQAEFLALLKNGDDALVDAARERMRLLGMSPELIDQVETERRTQATVTIRAPIGGALESVDAREGMTVDTGMTLAKINGLDTVWLEAALPEAQAEMAAVGQAIEAQLTAFPGRSFDGKIIALLPEANAETRTLRLRAELKNDNRKLRPGMFARVRLEAPGATAALMVPSEAVIRSGSRNIVLVAEDQGRFVPTEVRVGVEANGKTVIVDGLQAGQKVVASGQFLIDSEANLNGVLARLGARSDSREQTPASATHVANGKVESIAGEKIIISHGPVASLEWPSMTMGFKLENADVAGGIEVGDAIKFRFRQADGEFVVEHLEAEGKTERPKATVPGLAR
jgi:membrane fusion protein, copper/silver efflux system